MDSNELNVFAAAMRKTETGRYDPKNRATNYVGWDDGRGTRLVGSYSIPEDYWPMLAATAGMPGARWQDPSAQDRVMKGVFNLLYEEYQDWRLVAVAWKAGQDVADNLLNDPTGLQREKTGNLAKFVDTVMADAKNYEGPELPMPEEGSTAPTNPFTVGNNATDTPATGNASTKPGDMVRSVLVTMRDAQRRRSPIGDPAVDDTMVTEEQQIEPEVTL